MVNKSVKKTLIDNITKPLCISIFALVFVIFFNFNPLFLVFDLFIKTFEVVSGYALINDVLNGTFDAKSPVFIVYISVLIASFLFIVYKIFRSKVNSSLSSSDFSSSNSSKFSTNKIKWIAIWLLSWFIMPFFFMAIMYTINFITSFFQMDSSSISSLISFTSKDWDNVSSKLSFIIQNNITEIEGWLNTYFPENIDAITKIPENFSTTDLTLEQYKTFLKNLSTNAEAIKFKENVETLKNLYISLLKEQFFNKGYLNGNIANVSVNKMQDITNAMISSYNQISSIVSDSNVFDYNSLLIAVNKAINVTSTDGVPLSPEVIKELTNSVNNTREVINDGLYNIEKIIIYGPLDGMCSFGIEGQKWSSDIYSFKPNSLTILLASLLYQQPVTSFHFYYDTNSNIQNIANFIPSQLPLVGSNFTNIFTNYDFNSMMKTLGSNPLQLIVLIIGTVSFSICIFLFWKIITVYLFKLCNYVYMLFISPFTSSQGIEDSGEKFQKWFKKIIGKGIVLLVVSLTVTVFAIIVNLGITIIKQSGINVFVYQNLDQLQNISKTRNMESILILSAIVMVFIYALSNGILELINVTCNKLDYQKPKKLRKLKQKQEEVE